MSMLKHGQPGNHSSFYCPSMFFFEWIPWDGGKERKANESKHFNTLAIYVREELTNLRLQLKYIYNFLSNTGYWNEYEHILMCSITYHFVIP